MLQRNINETTVGTVLDLPATNTAGWVQLSWGLLLQTIACQCALL